MMNQTIFKRYEYKYLLTEEQKKDLLAYMKPYMRPDRFGFIPTDGHRMTAKHLSN